MRKPGYLRILLLAILVDWLPLSVLAHHEATRSMAQALTGHQHPGLPQPGDIHFDPVPEDTLVIDLAGFWRSVDNYDNTCHENAACQLVQGMALPATLSLAVASNSHAAPWAPASSFRSREPSPDSPPPRF